jgi:hypothetical protein
MLVKLFNSTFIDLLLYGQSAFLNSLIIFSTTLYLDEITVFFRILVLSTRLLYISLTIFKILIALFILHKLLFFTISHRLNLHLLIILVCCCYDDIFVGRLGGNFKMCSVNSKESCNFILNCNCNYSLSLS